MHTGLFKNLLEKKMSFSINTNLSALNGMRHLEGSTSLLATSSNRLSSGLKINSAKDDAAGLAIASGMESTVRGMSVAMRNAYDGISLVQTAEGSLSALGDTLQRMRELAVQSASSATLSASDRDKLQTEFGALNDELSRIVQSSQYNGKKLLNGDLEIGVVVQVGANSDTDNRITVRVQNMSNVLSPVTSARLMPDKNALDSTLSAIISEISNNAVADPQLQLANSATQLANVAVAAAQAASESPTDLALAKIASKANLDAAKAISASSAAVLSAVNTDANAGLLTADFFGQVNNAYESNLATEAALDSSDIAIQNSTETDSNNATALLNNASALATAAMQQVNYAGRSGYISNVSLLNERVASTLQINTSETVSTQVSGVMEKALALGSLDIAKAIANASYVEDTNKTQKENESNKQYFVDNHFLVSEAADKINQFGNDYALLAIDRIDAAIESINSERAVLGSLHNPLTAVIDTLQNGIENQSAAKSRIVDADFAQETANVSRAQILQQVGTAMLAQANQSPQLVGSLLAENTVSF